VCHTLYSLVICFAPSLSDSLLFLTLTRLVVVIKFVNFSFALFTPPLGDFQCLDGFSILHSKLLEYILNVLSLANEGALLELLDLKSKEKLQLPIIDISNFCIIILLNSSHVDLLVDLNIISST
jgi:hypothetical protein